MRKTEFWLGVCAGAAGLLLAVLSLLGILTYLEEAVAAHAYVCIAANVVGIFGAVVVRKHNILGAAIMAAAMVTIMCFGFPWQSIPAVMYIISFVMAAVPEKLHSKDEQGRLQ